MYAWLTQLRLRFTGQARRQGAPRGQSLVEFALIGSLLIAILVGVLDLGRAYFSYLALKDASGEGAYFASAFPQCEIAADCANPNNVEYRVKNSSPNGLIDWTTVAVTTIVPDLSEGNLVTVTVTFPYTIMTPLIGSIAGGQTIPLTASSVSIIVRGDIVDP